MMCLFVCLFVCGKCYLLVQFPIPVHVASLRGTASDSFGVVFGVLLCVIACVSVYVCVCVCMCMCVCTNT